MRSQQSGHFIGPSTRELTVREKLCGMAEVLSSTKRAFLDRSAVLSAKARREMSENPQPSPLFTSVCDSRARSIILGSALVTNDPVALKGVIDCPRTPTEDCWSPLSASCRRTAPWMSKPSSRDFLNNSDCPGTR